MDIEHSYGLMQKDHNSTVLAMVMGNALVLFLKWIYFI